MLTKSYPVLPYPLSKYTPTANTVIHKPKVQFLLERGSYIVKLAETALEFQSLFRLRRKVFQKEFKRKIFSLRSDRESFDDYADFLIIVDKKRKKVVGTYRLIVDVDPKLFYTASEFDLGKLQSLNGRKLELSRACIHRKYRTGMVMHLLWKGVAAYGQKLGIRYLFGCASVISTDPKFVASLVCALKADDKFDSSLNIRPKSKYNMDGLQAEIDKIADNTKASMVSMKNLPPLFRAYLKAGAKIHGLPAVDWAFRCVDFFTVLDLENLNESHERKYLNEDPDSD